MNKIRLLDDRTIDKIAAGEVVERPASIVKELLENAIDAGATGLDIELEDGGRSLIRVRDNGCGIQPADVPLALTRHATSKISGDEDLFQIQTMGFRGEALASIAAVSRFHLSTQCPDETFGTRLSAEGGHEPRIEVWQGQVGTLVEVADLFFNVPARRAFLKSSAAEFAACLELVHAFALAHKHCGFKLTHNRKRVLECLAVPTLRQRVAQIYGEETSDLLIEIERKSKYVNVTGLISAPGNSYATSKHMYCYLNRRWLKDKLLRYAIVRGYHSHLLRSRYPFVVLHLESDPSLIDVNVHPAKTEVRWQYASEIQSVVALAIREGLQNAAWAMPKAAEPLTQVVSTPSLPSTADFFLAPRAPTQSHVSSFGLGEMGDRSVSYGRRPIAPVKALTTLNPERSAPVSPERRSISWSELSYLGCFNRCYLLFEDREGFLLAVDQHAFHERILYERLQQNQAILYQSQPLAIPELVSLSPVHVARLTTLAQSQDDVLRAFKFTVLDHSSVEVTAVPSLVSHRPIEEILTAIATGSAFDAAALVHDLMSTFACHAAVRAGEELPEEDLRLLLAAASAVDFYHNCPHGRPVFRWWSTAQVAAWFDRT